MKKNPQRMCIACRQMLDKAGLIRVVKSKDGTIELDILGKKDGRGAYICKLDTCIAKCIKTKAINRAFKTQVNQNIYDALQCTNYSVQITN